MTYLCVDIALDKSGLVIVQDDKVIYKQDLVLKKTLPRYNKVAAIYESMMNVFSIMNGEFVLLIEDRLKHGWSSTALASIEAARASCILAYKHYCEKHELKETLVLYDPQDIKVFCGAKKNSNKDVTREAALTKFPQYKKLDLSEDQMDAFIIYLRHTH